MSKCQCQKSYYILTTVAIKENIYLHELKKRYQSYWNIIF
jgi:hypothetical protein